MNEEKRKSSARMALEAYIASRPMRLTPERLAILDRIMDRRDAFSASSLGVSLADEGFRVSRATLYNTLRLFQESGIIERVPDMGTTPSEGTLWQVALDRNFSMTLVCTRCGSRRAVRDQALARQLSARRFASFVPSGIDICVRGLCSRCRRRQ